MSALTMYEEKLKQLDLLCKQRDEIEIRIKNLQNQLPIRISGIECDRCSDIFLVVFETKKEIAENPHPYGYVIDKSFKKLLERILKCAKQENCDFVMCRFQKLFIPMLEKEIERCDGLVDSVDAFLNFIGLIEWEYFDYRDETFYVESKYRKFHQSITDRVIQSLQ